MRARNLATGAAAAALAVGAYAVGANQSTPVATAQNGTQVNLWKTYSDVLTKARYISLNHVLTPTMPVWKGFGPSTFSPTVDPATKQPYTYEKEGFAATHYDISTDQFGTQLDPPAHWAPEYAGIDELPATFAVRPLVVISIVDQVKKKGDYHLQVADIQKWEKANGRIPEGSVVMVRSDWSKKWTSDPKKAAALAADPVFPGVSLDAIKFLQLKRHILFHGHEPLDTDTTPTLEGESWLMHHGYTQAEGVDNLDKVPETGCLVSIGFPRFKGGTGGLASFTAICPPGVKGEKISRADAPLKKFSSPLHWDDATGTRVR
ncbi:cyclase family protein [Solirubrobacter ginsenosidimutans]|uniref:Cyclase family protein n=1 Tax=Solirubrobacter ginsenosidimutans TaxID=490573 RepID=A0A9X3S6U2_9ACTN|nr:cyclase family protein [Solirubrobacter ginsenosidimutans]MDA0162853.1 cyclase family protein [Solirubrobacter ginsenosidimutans]